jgi:hypothetical protein
MKTIVRPSRRAFFQPWPIFGWPSGHGVSIALTRASGGFLWAPLPAAQHAPDPGGTIGDPKVLCNHRGNTPQGPEFIPKAMGMSALAEQVEQIGALRNGEFGFTAGMPFGREASLTLVREGIPPATDRAGRSFDLARHLAHPPADCQQGHGHTTTNFQLLFGACGSHTPLIGTAGSFF